MIRKFNQNDINQVMKIWLDVNIETHNYISSEYWTEQFDYVKEILPKSEIYVFENKNKIVAFIGIVDNYIAGIFVLKNVQSNGIGKLLLDHAKEIKNNLSLSVYKKNKRAILFYQRAGFVIKNEMIDKDTGEYEIEMVWEKNYNDVYTF